MVEAVVAVIAVVVEGIVVVIVSGEVWGGLSGVSVVVGEVLAAVDVAIVLPSNARPRRINTSRRIVEPAVPLPCVRSRWRPTPAVRPKDKPQ